MAQPKQKTDGKTTMDESTNLKGTLISSFFVGFVIVAVWAGVYFLYLSRF